LRRWLDSRLARRIERARPDTAALGQLGETLAAKHLRSRGLKVLYRNYRAPRGGELDIVCRDRDTLVFVEVKTRSSSRYARPADNVNAEKRRLIFRGANSWLSLLDHPDVLLRFDIVEVILEPGSPPAFQHLADAFTPPENLLLTSPKPRPHASLES
jgi:putative endonuclease